MDSKRVLIGSLLVVMSLLLIGCRPASDAATASEGGSNQGVTYKIGFAPGVTGGGSFLGEPERNVGEIIAAQLEASGGIVGQDGVRHEVEVIIGDTETNPDVAVSLAGRDVYLDREARG